MKKTILFVLTLIVLAAAAFFALNFGQAPVMQAPGENIPAATAPSGTSSEPSGSPGGDVNGAAGMANPASVFCVQQGGKLEIREGEGGQYGVCIMPNGAQCDEWEFFRTKQCGTTGSEQPGNSAVCGRENCHGLDIKCGPNPAEVCTMIYQLGDKCLRLVNCGIVNGTCQQIPNAAFDACKSCVQKCEADFAADQIKLFDCESKCPVGSESGVGGKICADCGQGGWEKMDQKCNQTISNKNDFKNCLIGFSWSQVTRDTEISQFTEGYIEIGGMEKLSQPTAKSIKVFIYNQWAADSEGNLYLLGVLG